MICDVIAAADQHRIVGVFDDNPARWGEKVLGSYPVLGPLSDWRKHPVEALVIAIGDNQVRKALFEQLKSEGATFASVIHPRASLGRSISVGEGVAIFANAVVNPGAVVGDNVILNTACSVDHDCTVGAHSHLSAGVNLAGGTTLGEGVLIGIGATISVDVTVGDWSVVGAGSVVIRDVAARATVAGVPARELSRK